MADRHLSLIRGEGNTTGTSRRAELAVVEGHRECRDQLLFRDWFEQPAGALFARPASGRLLSVGFDTLDFDGFRTVLVQSRVKYVLDMRLLASFRGRGFSPDLVDRTFIELGISYERSIDLANAYVGTSSNVHSVMQLYSMHLRNDGIASLDRLISWLRAGPVLLLGRDPTHFGAERQLVVDCIAERFVPLEVVVLNSCRQAEFDAMAYLIGEAALAADQKKKKRRRKRTKKKRQLELPSTSRREK